MPSIVEVLKAGLDAATTITLVYNAGTKPGRARTVLPVSVLTDRLIAIDPESKTQKIFLFRHIASAELLDGLKATSDEAVSVVISDTPKLETLTAYVEHLRPELIAAGLILYETRDSFGVGFPFKNGKPKTHPDVSVFYLPAMLHYVDNAGRERTEKPPLTGRARPWHVGGRTFGQLDRAITVFMKEVRAMIARRGAQNSNSITRN